MVLMLSVHPSRQGDLLGEHRIRLSDGIASRDYIDTFGNICTRLVAPPGVLEIRNEFLIQDSGLPDKVAPDARELAINELPDESLRLPDGQPLLRYPKALRSRVVAVRRQRGRLAARAGDLQLRARPYRVRLSPCALRPHRFGGHDERRGVCRDFAHLAVTLCRCMNIPARYCTGYLGDIGVPRDPAPMDFSAWFEVFLEGRWFTFDARHNHPRIGRIVIARGRDAADVAISTGFGFAQLARFSVITERFRRRGRHSASRRRRDRRLSRNASYEPDASPHAGDARSCAIAVTSCSRAQRACSAGCCSARPALAVHPTRRR